MKKHVLVALVGAVSLVPALSFAESTTINPAVVGSAASARLDFTVVIPAVLYLRIGTGSAIAAANNTTVDGITFTVPGVSWQGHVGGLVTGALIAAAYVYPPKERRTAVQLGVSVAALVIFAGLIVWRTAGLIDYYGALITG